MSGRCGMLEERGEDDVSRVEMHFFNLSRPFTVGHLSLLFAPTDRGWEEARCCK